MVGNLPDSSVVEAKENRFLDGIFGFFVENFDLGSVDLIVFKLALGGSNFVILS